MNKNKKAPERANLFTKGQHKDNHSTTQYQDSYNLFFESPKSRKQVHIITGYLESNVCRYVGKMRKSGLIQVVDKRRCQYTKRIVEFLTTDRNLFNKQNVQQLNLFDDGRL